jgi:hypothetical protein
MTKDLLMIYLKRFLEDQTIVKESECTLLLRKRSMVRDLVQVDQYQLHR